MNEPTHPLIFFDVMDTLVYNPFFKEIPVFFGLTHPELVLLKHPTVWIEFECGKIPESEYLRRHFADGRSFDEQAFLACMRAAYRWLDGMDQLLKDLHSRRVEMHTLSNYPVWYRTIEEKLQLTRYLKWTSVSCLTGMRKPAPEAYLSAANQVGRVATACLFIDDSRENCAGAEAVGMPAILFTGAADLRSELVRRGVL